MDTLNHTTDRKTRPGHSRDESLTDRLTCSIGIMAYNEEANIGNLLQAISSQRTEMVEITEIVVVASGCTDRTEEIVRNYAAIDKKVRLLVQDKREGKASGTRSDSRFI